MKERVKYNLIGHFFFVLKDLWTIFSSVSLKMSACVSKNKSINLCVYSPLYV